MTVEFQCEMASDPGVIKKETAVYERLPRANWCCSVTRRVSCSFLYHPHATSSSTFWTGFALGRGKKLAFANGVVGAPHVTNPRMSRDSHASGALHRYRISHVPGGVTTMIFTGGGAVLY